MAEVWFKKVSHITFHDPLAAALVFQPDLCRYAHGRVDIVLGDSTGGGPLAGLTRWIVPEPGAAATDNKPGATVPAVPPTPHTIAVDVDADRFFEHYFAVVDPAGQTA
jgi:purine nucleosidase